MTLAVHDFAKLAPRHLLRLVVHSAQGLQGFGLGDLKFVLAKLGTQREIAKKPENDIQILLAATHGAFAVFKTNGKSDGRRFLIQDLLDILRRMRKAAAVGHRLSKKRSQAHFIDRVGLGSALEIHAHLDERQLVVFQEIDHEAITQNGASGFGRIKLRRRKRGQRRRRRENKLTCQTCRHREGRQAFGDPRRSVLTCGQDRLLRRCAPRNDVRGLHCFLVGSNTPIVSLSFTKNFFAKFCRSCAVMPWICFCNCKRCRQSPKTV